jgi:hypothetical protein
MTTGFVTTAKLFTTVNPLPNLAPTWNMAPTMDAPVARLHSNGALPWRIEVEPAAIFHERPEESAQADQRQVGDYR